MIWLILLGVYILITLACRRLIIYTYEKDGIQDFDICDFWLCITPVVNFIYVLILIVVIIDMIIDKMYEQNMVDKQHNIINKFFGKK